MLINNQLITAQRKGRKTGIRIRIKESEPNTFMEDPCKIEN